MPTKTVSIATLVDLLRSTEGAPITSSRIADLLASVRLDPASMRRFVRHGDDHYMRHLIHRDEVFDIMAICWLPGQGTPIHTHNGQLGWAFAVEGAIDCTEYAYLGCDRPQNQNVAGLDCLAGGMKVKLEPTRTIHCERAGGINIVDKQVTIHALTVPPDCDEPVVTLHVYSLPFDSCVIFDVARGRCERKELAFDSAPEGYTVRVR